MKTDIFEAFDEKVLITDGAVGTEIAKRGAPADVLGESLNLTHPEIVKNVFQTYADAGSNILKTNTFSSNRPKLKKFGLLDKFEEINQKGIEISRSVSPDCYVMGEMGALDECVEPIGKSTYDEVYDEYYAWAKTLQKADLLSLETMSDIKMFKAAAAACKDACPNTPLVGMMTFEK